MPDEPENNENNVENRENRRIEQPIPATVVSDQQDSLRNQSEGNSVARDRRGQEINSRNVDFPISISRLLQDKTIHQFFESGVSRFLSGSVEFAVQRGANTSYSVENPGGGPEASASVERTTDGNGVRVSANDRIFGNLNMLVNDGVLASFQRAFQNPTDANSTPNSPNANPSTIDFNPTRGPDNALLINNEPNSQMSSEKVQLAMQLIQTTIQQLSQSLNIPINFPGIALNSRESLAELTTGLQNLFQTAELQQQPEHSATALSDHTIPPADRAAAPASPWNTESAANFLNLQERVISSETPLNAEQRRETREQLVSLLGANASSVVDLMLTAQSLPQQDGTEPIAQQEIPYQQRGQIESALNTLADHNSSAEQISAAQRQLTASLDALRQNGALPAQFRADLLSLTTEATSSAGRRAISDQLNTLSPDGRTPTNEADRNRLVDALTASLVLTEGRSLWDSSRIGTGEQSSTVLDAIINNADRTNSNGQRLGEVLRQQFSASPSSAMMNHVFQQIEQRVNNPNRTQEQSAQITRLLNDLVPMPENGRLNPSFLPHRVRIENMGTDGFNHLRTTDNSSSGRSDRYAALTNILAQNIRANEPERLGQALDRWMTANELSSPEQREQELRNIVDNIPQNHPQRANLLAAMLSNPAASASPDLQETVLNALSRNDNSSDRLRQLLQNAPEGSPAARVIAAAELVRDLRSGNVSSESVASLVTGNDRLQQRALNIAAPDINQETARQILSGARTRLDSRESSEQDRISSLRIMSTLSRFASAEDLSSNYLVLQNTEDRNQDLRTAATRFALDVVRNSTDTGLRHEAILSLARNGWSAETNHEVQELMWTGHHVINGGTGRSEQRTPPLAHDPQFRQDALDIMVRASTNGYSRSYYNNSDGSNNASRESLVRGLSNNAELRNQFLNNLPTNTDLTDRVLRGVAATNPALRAQVVESLMRPGENGAAPPFSSLSTLAHIISAHENAAYVQSIQTRAQNGDRAALAVITTLATFQDSASSDTSTNNAVLNAARESVQVLAANPELRNQILGQISNEYQNKPFGDNTRNYNQQRQLFAALAMREFGPQESVSESFNRIESHLSRLDENHRRWLGDAVRSELLLTEARRINPQATEQNALSSLENSAREGRGRSIEVLTQLAQPAAAQELQRGALDALTRLANNSNANEPSRQQARESLLSLAHRDASLRQNIFDRVHSVAGADRTLLPLLTAVGQNMESMPAENRVQGLLVSALRTGDSNAFRTLQIMRDSDPRGRDAFVQAIMPEIARSYRPQDTAALPAIAALIGNETAAPPNPSGPYAATQLFRESVERIQTSIRDSANNANSQASRNALLDILAVTAAGPGSRASEAAHALIGVEGQSRIPALLSSRNFDDSQTRYLLNLYSHRANSGTTYEHNDGPVPYSATSNPLINNYISAGLGGNDARERQGAVWPSPLRITDQDIRQAGTSITALNSQRASEIEAALTRNNMATLVGSYTTRPGGMSFAQRDQTILGLVNASTNTEISPEARRLAMQTLSAAVSNDSQINTTLPQALPLITRLATEGNRNAQQVLLNFANSGDASATVAQEASRVLLEQGRQNPAFRDSILQTPITPANMPLMAALMSGASTVGTPAQARQQIIDLARNGNERAVSILLSVSTSSESGVAGNHRAAPTRESTWNAISEMYRWAQVPIRDGARESQDMGMGNLLQQLDQRLSQNSPSSWIAPTQEAYFHAARALLHISESSDIPTGFRQQALSMLSRSVSANYEAVMNNQRNGSEFRTSTALLSSLSSNPDAMRRLAEQFNVPGPNSLRNTVEHLQQTATRGFWNADNERAVTALLTIANNQLAPASVRTQARDGLRAAAEGTNADRVLPRLRDAAGHDNNAAATVLSQMSTGISRQEAIDALVNMSGARITPEDTRAGQDRRLQRVFEGWQARANTGDAATMNMLVNMATGRSTSPQMREAAAGMLRTAMDNGQQNVVANAVQLAWQADRQNGMSFALMASVAAQMTDNAQLAQNVRSGYAGIMSDTSAENASLRQIATASMISNPQLLTADSVRTIVANMSPEVASIVPSLLRQDLANENTISGARNMFMNELRRVSQNPPENANIEGLARAWSALAPAMNANDVRLLSGLQSSANTDAAHQQVEQSLFSVLSQSQNRAVTRESLTALSDTPMWSRFNEAQQQALTEFATTGRTSDLSALNQAYVTADLPRSNYPLALTLRNAGLPAGTTDAEISDLAAQIMFHNGPGANRIVDSWVTPILSAANLSWERSHNGSTADRSNEANFSAYQNREQFILSVVQDLANGRLDQSRMFLTTEAQRLENNTTQLNRTIDTQSNELNTSQNNVRYASPLAAAIREFQSAQGRVESANSPHTGAGPENTEARASERRDAATQLATARSALDNAVVGATNIDSQMTDIILLQRNMARNIAEQRNQQAANIAAQHHDLVAQGQHQQADMLLLRAAGSGLTFTPQMQQELNQLWQRMQASGNAPSVIAPQFNGTPAQNLNRAIETLRGLQQNANLTGNDASLHMAALQSAADLSVAQIMSNPAVENMNQRSQQFALRVGNVMQLFELASTSPEARPQLRTHLESQVRGLIDDLDSPQMQDAARDLRTMVTRLETERSSMPEGSIGRQRLDQLINNMNSFLDLTRPGSQIRSQLDQIAVGLRDGQLNQPAFWQQALSTLAHVVTTTAAFAAATALSALAGPAAPVVWAILTPALTLAARHMTQELLHQTGVAHEGSRIGDVMFGRTFYDSNTGSYGARNSSQVWGFGEGGLGRDYLTEFGMNLSFAAVGRVGTAFGSASRGGSFAGALNPFRSSAAHEPFMREFIRGLGPGIGLAAPDLLGQQLGVNHLGLATGYVFSGIMGYRGGRSNPTPHAEATPRVTAAPELRPQAETTRPQNDPTNPPEHTATPTPPAEHPVTPTPPTERPTNPNPEPAISKPPRQRPRSNPDDFSELGIGPGGIPDRPGSHEFGQYFATGKPNDNMAYRTIERDAIIRQAAELPQAIRTGVERLVGGGEHGGGGPQGLELANRFMRLSPELRARSGLNDLISQPTTSLEALRTNLEGALSLVRTDIQNHARNASPDELTSVLRRNVNSLSEIINTPELLGQSLEALSNGSRLPTAEQRTIDTRINEAMQRMSRDWTNLSPEQRNNLSSQWLNYLSRSSTGENPILTPAQRSTRLQELLPRLGREEILALDRSDLSRLINLSTTPEMATSLGSQARANLYANMLEAVSSLPEAQRRPHQIDLMRRLTAADVQHMTPAQQETVISTARTVMPEAWRNLRLVSEHINPEVNNATISRLFEGFNQAELTSHLNARRDYLSQGATADLFTGRLDTFRQGGAVRITTEGSARPIEQVTVVANTMEGRNAAYLFGELTGTQVIFRESGSNSAAINFDRAPSRAPGVINDRAISGFHEGLNFIDLAVAQANPAAIPEPIRNLINVQRTNTPMSSEQIQGLERLLNDPIREQRRQSLAQGSAYLAHEYLRQPDAHDAGGSRTTPALQFEQAVRGSRLLAQSIQYANHTAVAESMQSLHTQVLNYHRTQAPDSQLVFVAQPRENTPVRGRIADSVQMGADIYRRANNIPEAQFVTPEQLRLRLQNGENLTIVALNDGIGGGTEANTILANINRDIPAGNRSRAIYGTAFASTEGLATVNSNPGRVLALAGTTVNLGENTGRAIPANPTNSQAPSNAAKPFTPGNYAPNGAQGAPTGFVYQHMVPNTVNADLSAILQAMGLRGTTARTVRR